MWARGARVSNPTHTASQPLNNIPLELKSPTFLSTYNASLKTPRKTDVTLTSSDSRLPDDYVSLPLRLSVFSRWLATVSLLSILPCGNSTRLIVPAGHTVFPFTFSSTAGNVLVYPSPCRRGIRFLYVSGPYTGQFTEVFDSHARIFQPPFSNTNVHHGTVFIDFDSYLRSPAVICSPDCPIMDVDYKDVPPLGILDLTSFQLGRPYLWQIFVDGYGLPGLPHRVLYPFSNVSIKRFPIPTRCTSSCESKSLSVDSLYSDSGSNYFGYKLPKSHRAWDPCNQTIKARSDMGSSTRCASSGHGRGGFIRAGDGRLDGFKTTVRRTFPHRTHIWFVAASAIMCEYSPLVCSCFRALSTGIQSLAPCCGLTFSHEWLAWFDNVLARTGWQYRALLQDPTTLITQREANRTLHAELLRSWPQSSPLAALSMLRRMLQRVEHTNALFTPREFDGILEALSLDLGSIGFLYAFKRTEVYTTAQTLIQTHSSNPNIYNVAPLDRPYVLSHSGWVGFSKNMFLDVYHSSS